MEIRDAIIQICNQRGYDSELVFKRGRPSREAMEIRSIAEQMCRGSKPVAEMKRAEPKKRVLPEGRTAKPQVVKTNVQPQFTETEKTEADDWWDGLSDNLKRYFVPRREWKE
jgi:hypothetical protein